MGDSRFALFFCLVNRRPPGWGFVTCVVLLSFFSVCMLWDIGTWDIVFSVISLVEFSTPLHRRWFRKGARDVRCDRSGH